MCHDIVCLNSSDSCRHIIHVQIHVHRIHDAVIFVASNSPKKVQRYQEHNLHLINVFFVSCVNYFNADDKKYGKSGRKYWNLPFLLIKKSILRFNWMKKKKHIFGAVFSLNELMYD